MHRNCNYADLFIFTLFNIGITNYFSFDVDSISIAFNNLAVLTISSSIFFKFISTSFIPFNTSCKTCKLRRMNYYVTYCNTLQFV